MAVREKRIERGMSIKALSKEVGVTDAFIRLIEYGRKEPSLKIARKIAAALNCTLDELFAETTEG